MKLLSLAVVFFVSLIAQSGWAVSPSKYRYKIGFFGFEGRNFKVAGGEEIASKEMLNHQFLEYYSSDPRFVLIDSTDQRGNCLLNQPQLLVDGHILGFEVKSEKGLRFGFEPQVDFVDWMNAQVSIGLKATQLDLQMFVKDNDSQSILSVGRARGFETRKKIHGTINFSDWVLKSYYYYRQTPMAEVTGAGLRKVVGRAFDRLQDVEWRARVVEQLGAIVVIDAGKQSGVQVGDRIELYPVKHFWEGVACQSAYVGSLKYREKSVIGTVVHVGDGVSEVNLNIKSSQQFQAGDEATIFGN